jgi:four helix bundle protein
MSLTSLRIHTLAVELSSQINALIDRWPKADTIALGDQLRRSIASVPSNIAEGYGRAQTGERLQFMFYADGSIQEAKSQIIQAGERGLLSADDSLSLSERLTRLSISLIEFCNAMLNRDPEYKGGYRKRVEDRRKWLLER